MYKHTNITISRNFFKKVVTNTRQTTLTKQKLLSGAKIGGVCKNTGEPTDKHSTQSTSEGSSLPKTGTPYSSKDLEDSEGVKQRRYYDKNGNADMDIDYRHGGTGHTFPHRHDWNNGVRGPAY